MLVPYTCCTKKFEDYYAEQTGKGLPYYRGTVLQRGHGIGGFFAKLFRSAMPLLMRGAKTIGKEALRTGTMVANDMLSGESFNSSLKTRANETGKKFARKAVPKADEMTSHGKFKRKQKFSKHFIRSKAWKVQRRDIFA